MSASFSTSLDVTLLTNWIERKRKQPSENKLRTWKQAFFGNVCLLKGHGVSLFSRPRASLSADPNWPLVSWSWCDRSGLCVRPSPRPSKALVSSEQLWVHFQMKCHLLAPISADKCPQSQVGGRLGPSAQNTADFWKEQAASSSSSHPLPHPLFYQHTLHPHFFEIIHKHALMHIFNILLLSCKNDRRQKFYLI